MAQNVVAWLDGFITLLWLEFEVLSIHNLLTANLAEFAKHVHGFIIPSVETASIVNIPQQREMRRVGNA